MERIYFVLKETKVVQGQRSNQLTLKGSVSKGSQFLA
jgi:hypothetical protein